MRKELDDVLRARYPLVFLHSRRGDFPFECNDGWFDLIDALGAALQRETDLHGAPQAVAYRVRQKSGTLDFGAEGADHAQRALIDMAEDLSGSICEICGNRGRLLLTPGRGFWPLARCPEHAPAGAVRYEGK